MESSKKISDHSTIII